MLADVTLEDKYTRGEGPVFMTGLQALVRLPMLQRDLDKAKGLNTAGYISGYRGSPLGGYDAALAKAKKHLEAHDIVFKPGINEDLAATAIWGTQQVNLYPGATVDGVFSIWYGKGPGIDRSADAIKHGNMAGVSPKGGVLLLVGDDHGAKSSTIAHQSDHTLIACGVPILHPANIEEFLSFGLFGLALSRFAGCWVAMKTITETVELLSGRDDRPDTLRFRDARGSNPRPLATHQARGRQARAGAADLRRSSRCRQAVRPNQRHRSGRDQERISKTRCDHERQVPHGLRARPRNPWHLGGSTRGAWRQRLQGRTRSGRSSRKAYAPSPRMLEELLVVEEKRPIIEDQVKALLFNAPDAPRRIVGKTDELGAPLLPAHGELSPLLVAKALLARLPGHADLDPARARIARLEDTQRAARGNVVPLTRNPFFCAGCPHNTSTKLPEGSRGMAGIGCHAMARWMDHLNTKTVTQMGGEGVNWIGHAPFTTERHVFQNIGDGTYFHSGIVAIRASIAANSNITYKILYNDAVAMTGGQPVEGGLTPRRHRGAIARRGSSPGCPYQRRPRTLSHRRRRRGGQTPRRPSRDRE